jgi:hypothetical protein
MEREFSVFYQSLLSALLGGSSNNRPGGQLIPSSRITAESEIDNPVMRCRSAAWVISTTNFSNRIDLWKRANTRSSYLLQFHYQCLQPING